MTFLKKPSLGGLFFMLLFAAALALPSVRLFQFYQPGKVSQALFLLLFVDLAFLALAAAPSRVTFRFGWPALLPASGSLLVILLNLENPAACAVVALFTLLFYLAPRAVDLRFCTLAVAAAALVTALLGLHDFWSFKLGLIPTLHPSYPGRLTGPFGQPNLFGAFLLLGLFCYFQALLAEGRRDFAAFLPAMVLTLALVLTTSRAVMLALILGGTLVLWTLIRKGLWRVHRRFLLGGVVAIFLAILLGSGLLRWEGEARTEVQAAARQGGLERVMETGGDQSAYMRLNYWTTALLIGADHPFTGAGIGRYRELLGDYMMPAAELLNLTYDSFQQTYWPHNDFFHVFSETGIFPLALLLAVLILVLREAWRRPATETLLVGGALVGFMVCMLLGHPLWYPATAFAFVLLAALCFPWQQDDGIRLSARALAWLLLPVLILVNLLLIDHFQRMNRLQDGFEALVEQEERTVEHYENVRRNYLEGNWDDGIYGWEYRDRFLFLLSRKALANDDRELAAWLLPQMLAFAEQNRFHYFDFLIGGMYYVLGDYETSRDYTRRAYEKKPDVPIYFDLYHINNAFLISQRHDRPIHLLINQKDLEMLKENRIIWERQFDETGVVKRSADPEPAGGG